MFMDVYGMTTDSQFINTIEDCIHDQGAMSQLISDSVHVAIITRVLYVLQVLCISDWQIEPHQQHQHPAERRYQTVT